MYGEDCTTTQDQKLNGRNGRVVDKSPFHTYMSNRVEPDLRHQEVVKAQRKVMNDRLIKSQSTGRKEIPDMTSALKKVRQSKRTLAKSFVQGTTTSPYR